MKDAHGCFYHNGCESPKYKPCNLFRLLKNLFGIIITVYMSFIYLYEFHSYLQFLHSAYDGNKTRLKRKLKAGM